MSTFTCPLLEIKGLPYGIQFTASIFFGFSHYTKDNSIKISLSKYFYKQLNSYELKLMTEK